jgi:diguanylate cyclase (GGDEF)-like protein/PAS domain S-box-containing protein
MVDERARASVAAADGELSSALLEAMGEAVYVVDRTRTITYWNPAAERLTGFTADEVVGRRCRDGILNHVDDQGTPLCATRCPLLATMRTGQPSHVSVFLHHHDGHRVPVEVSAARLEDGLGAVLGAVEVFHDDSRFLAVANELGAAKHAALTDPLTGLGNRRMLQQALDRHRSEHVRYARGWATLFIDIDHFKDVNDGFGHEVGDRVLQLVARTLRDCVRPSDTVGRWGGEEFLVLAPVEDEGQALALAERVRNLVASGWTDVDATKVGVTVCIGVAVSLRDEGAAETVARADSAMLSGKAYGRNRSVLG